MPAKASVKSIRISPRKVRLVVDLIRGQDAVTAEQQLTFLPKAAARPVLVLLRSAMANAENNFEMDKNNLFVKEIMVNPGPTYKRWHAESKGVAAEIFKRTSQMVIVLDERVKGKKKPKAKKAKAGQPQITRLKTKKEIAKLAAQDDAAKDQKRPGKFKDTHPEKKTGPGAGGFMNKIFRRKSSEN